MGQFFDSGVLVFPSGNFLGGPFTEIGYFTRVVSQVGRSVLPACDILLYKMLADDLDCAKSNQSPHPRSGDKSLR